MDAIRAESMVKEFGAIGEQDERSISAVDSW
jgi:hypothetical protein